MEASLEDKKVFVNILEALLFSSDAPLTTSRIREVIPQLTPKEIATAVQSLNEQYRDTARTFEIRNKEFFTEKPTAETIDSTPQN